MSVVPASERPLAFITGASSGIGLALAQRYQQAGYRLALVARRLDALQAFAQAQGLSAADCSVHAADVRDIDAITQAGRDCLARQGVPQVVIANAGVSIGFDTAVFDDLAVMRKVLETNVLGMAASFQPFIEPMRQRGSGRLVGMASVAGIRGLPGHGAYCASKAGSISYLESLRGELRASGVQVVTLVPGYVDTPLTRENRYGMPFLMAPTDFAEQAFRAVARGSSYHVIPWQMGVVAKCLRLLPNAWFDRLLAGRPRKHRQTPPA